MAKTALIIATDDNGAQSLFGIPNARRLVILASKLGFDKVHLFGRVDSLRSIISDLLPPQHFHPADDLPQLQAAIGRIEIGREDELLILKANVVVDRLSLTEFLEAGAAGQTLHMGLADDSGTDGIYLTSPSELTQVVEALWSPQPAGVTAVNSATPFQARTGLPCLLGQRTHDASDCEAKLMGVLAAQTAEGDGFMARHFDRKVSQFFSRRLVRTQVTPNQVTLMGVSIGLTGALLLSLPGYWPHLLGSLLFVFCVIVDGVDGEIARLKLMDSRFGHYLDITTDNLVHIAVFIGMAIGLFNETGNSLYLWALWFLLGGFAVCALAVYQCILRADAVTLERSPRLLRLMGMVSNRDFAYLVVLLAVADRLNWFLIGASAGTYLFAASLWILSSSERQKRPAL